MQYYNFDRLIKKYSCTFTVMYAKGDYDAMGVWRTTPTVVEKTGAIIGVSERKVYRSDGVFTEKDKELFMTESLGDITEAYVLHEGNKYSIQANPQPNPQFTGIYQYTLKWVRVFKEGDNID